MFVFYLCFSASQHVYFLSVVGTYFVKHVNIWPTLLIWLYNWNVFNLCEMTCLIRTIFSYWKAIPTSCTVAVHVSSCFLCVCSVLFLKNICNKAICWRFTSIILVICVKLHVDLNLSWIELVCLLKWKYNTFVETDIKTTGFSASYVCVIRILFLTWYILSNYVSRLSEHNLSLQSEVTS